MTDKWTFIFFWLLLLIGAAVFWPALSGPFLLDDWIHLPKLAGNDGTIDSMGEVYQLVFSGGGFTGRPLSFLSLLISDNIWPTAPWSFKYTNLLFHLLNGVLVFVFCRQLAAMTKTDHNQSTRNSFNLVALAAMGFWLIHPLHLSPTMMVIQRMTLLMATCTLLGLITYLKGRQIVLANPRSGYIIMTTGVVGFGALGSLFKDTTIMMVCYIIALELTIFSKIEIPNKKHWRIWYFTFLVLPLIGMWAYFLYKMPYMDQLFLKREFTMYERLITESRILIDYLRVIILPSMSETGPYHDDYMISRGVLSPASTLVSLILITVLIGLAIRFRKKFPLASMAILWFFAGHMLESTILPLELYFEHRNYLPMLGIVFAACFWVVHQTKKVKVWARGGAIAFLCLEAGITYASAQVWGNPALIANVWAYENPSSLRAQFDAIVYWIGQEDFERVRHHLKTAIERNPTDAGIRLYSFIVDNCVKQTDLNIGSSLDELKQLIPSAHFEHASLDGVKFLFEKTLSGRCRTSYEDILTIIDAYLQNKRFSQENMSRAFLYQVQSKVYTQLGDLNNAILALDKTYEAMPKYGFALHQAYLLYTAGLYDDALEYIEKAKNTKAVIPFAGRLWKNDNIENVERAIREAKQKRVNLQLNKNIRLESNSNP